LDVQSIRQWLAARTSYFGVAEKPIGFQTTRTSASACF